MDARKGLTQTTQGLWVSISHTLDGKVLLIVDVQGSDNSETSKTFDSKSCLFSLAAGSVLIVNMNEMDVNRFDGGQRQLLSTVIEAMLKLHTKDMKKTTLLFAIRNTLDGLPEQLREANVRQMLNTVWDGLEKPEGVTLNDLFTVVVHGMAHITRDADGRAAVAVLRQWFCNPTHPNYLFRDRSQLRKFSDAKEAMDFFRELWASVLANKDLNVKTMLELLAAERCDNTAKAILQTTKAAVASKKALMQTAAAPLDNRGEVAHVLSAALTTFDTQAFRGVQDVYAGKRGELQTALNDINTQYNVNYTTLLNTYTAQQNLNKVKKGSIKKSSIAKGIKIAGLAVLGAGALALGLVCPFAAPVLGAAVAAEAGVAVAGTAAAVTAVGITTGTVVAGAGVAIGSGAAENYLKNEGC